MISNIIINMSNNIEEIIKTIKIIIQKLEKTFYLSYSHEKFNVLNDIEEDQDQEELFEDCIIEINKLYQIISLLLTNEQFNTIYKYLILVKDDFNNCIDEWTTCSIDDLLLYKENIETKLIDLIQALLKL